MSASPGPGRRLRLSWAQRRVVVGLVARGQHHVWVPLVRGRTYGRRCERSAERQTRNREHDCIAEDADPPPREGIEGRDQTKTQSPPLVSRPRRAQR
jgi:hypothetical protein